MCDNNSSDNFYINFIAQFGELHFLLYLIIKTHKNKGSLLVGYKYESFNIVICCNIFLLLIVLYLHDNNIYVL